MMTLLAGLLVINVYQTKDQDRIEKIEETPTSFKIYPSSSSRRANETLSFFKQLSQQDGVTVIKTDYSGQQVIKSAIANKKSFPYYQFFGKEGQFNLFSDKKTTYIQRRDIPVFWNSEQIKLQSMDNFFGNKNKIVDGVYTIILKDDQRKRVIQKLVTFFKEPQSALFTPKEYSVKGYVNRNLLIYLALFLTLMFLTILTIFAIPMTSIKQIGVYKLLGLSNLAVIWKLFKQPCIITLGAIIAFDVGVKLFFAYLPAGFISWLLLSQLAVILILAFAILIAFSLIKNIRVITLLKRGLNFNLGMAITLFLKTVTLVLTTVLLIDGIAHVRAISDRSNQYERVARLGSYLTIEQINLTTPEAIRNEDMHNGKNEEQIARLFNKLEQKSNAYFIAGEVVNPRKNLARFKVKDTFARNNNYQVVRVNQNYLDNIGLIANSRQKNTFYVPYYLKKEQDKVVKLASLLVLDRADEQKAKHQAMPKVNIKYYHAKYQTPVYINDQLEVFKQPLYELVDSHKLDHWSKLQLSSSGLMNPLRIKNTRKNRKIIKRWAAVKRMQGVSMKFAPTTALANKATNAYRGGLLIVAILLSVTFCISLIVSVFTAILFFRTNSLKLSILRLLGFGTIARYWKITAFLASMYLVQIVVACFIGKTIWALLIGSILAGFDLILVLAVFTNQENKNMVQVLKGE